MWRKATDEELNIINNTFKSKRSKIVLIGINVIAVVVLSLFLFVIPLVFKDDVVIGVIVGCVIIVGIVFKFGKNIITEVKKATEKNIFIYDTVIINKYCRNADSYYYVTVEVEKDGAIIQQEIIIDRVMYHNIKIGDKVSIVRYGEDYSEKSMDVLN